MFMFQEGPPAPGTPSASGGAFSDYLNQAQTMGASGGIGPMLGQGVGDGTTSYTLRRQQSINDPFVYVGTTPRNKAGKNTGSNAAEFGANPQLQGSTLSDLQRQFIQLDAEKQRHWAYLLALTGYASPTVAADATKAAEFAKTAPLSTVIAMHQAFLQDAADQFNLYRRKITPQGLMKEMLSYRLGKDFNGDINSVKPGVGGSSLAGTHTATSKSVDYLNPEDAKGMVRNMLQQQLGRDPSQAEYEDFVATIHAAERANPSTSTTTYTTDEQGNTTNQSTVSHGGLNQSGYDQLLYDKARSLPSWAIWQAVGTYAPALFQALDAPVSGV